MTTTSYNFLTIATGRRSVRKFDGRALALDELRPALEAFRFAPSAGNRQPWRVVVVLDAEKIKHIRKHCTEQPDVSESAGALLIP
jgi:nitroreductase